MDRHEELLDLLQQQSDAMKETRRQYEIHILKVVAELRADGESWAKIGKILGYTRQGTRQKFQKYLEEETTRTVKIREGI